MSTGPAETPETLTVALADPIDLARAPIPTNDSERLLFRRHSETLVRLDCHGEVRPGLASEWTGDSTGRRWIFTLRQNAHPPDRAPLTAARVVSSWHDRRGTVDALGIDSAVALDDGRLSVTLRAIPDSAPRLFADPALAVPRAGDSAESTARIPLETGSGPIVAFLVAPDGDPRDALDRGADLVVTRDPAVVDYVANRAEFRTFPLPWSRTYVLLQPAGAHPIWTLGVDSIGRSLARDVAQADARGAEPSVWRRECPDTRRMSHIAPPPISPRIVYPRGDKVARGLAERIVALTRDTVPLRSAGLAPAEFAAAVHNQHDRGYILGLPRQVPAPCHELAALPAGGSIQPLIDTRAHAIVRRGSPPLTVDWDGTVRVVPR